MVGIVGYGSYIPVYRIKVDDIAKQWGKDPESVKNMVWGLKFEGLKFSLNGECGM